VRPARNLIPLLLAFAGAENEEVKARLLGAVSRRRRRRFGHPTQEMAGAGGSGSGGVVRDVEALDGVRSIVLKPSESLDESRFTRIAGADFNDPGLGLQGLLGSFASTGFQASNLGDAIDVVNQMVWRLLLSVFPLLSVSVRWS
jgi:hypothetical protein